MAAAAREAGVSYGWAKKEEAKPRSGQEYAKEREQAKLPAPKSKDELKPEALRSLEDFEYFRRRYLGRISMPWQIETAEQIVHRLATPEKEFEVENVAPGTGKTTLAHDIAAWVTVRNRRIRGLFGSRIENNGRRQLRRLRRTLERTNPPKAKDEEISRGLAVDAVASLSVDFGFFKPITSDLWKADEFIVAQLDDEPIEEKEPTWSSYGMDSGVLGNRFDFIVWDDVVDKTTIRTLEAMENQRQWWDDEAETRLEPGGLLWLIGQRMAATDLYRYCLDKVVSEEDAEEDEDVDRPRMYHHIRYRAHYDEKCQGHPRGVPDADLAPYPEGCLLDPKRLPWKGKEGLRAIYTAKKRTYLVQYNQEDADPEDTLVQDVWIWGGTDEETGELAPGCTDEYRDLCELPQNLVGPKYSVATVDPSGVKMWAIQWWVHTPEASNQTFLMDLERKAMPANALLDWNANEGVFYGLMEEWQSRSVLLGHPITHWIVETNAAQRYLLQYDHVRRWMARWSVSIIPHTTAVRKLDKDFGPWTIRDHFRFGRIRLPMKQGTGARIQSLKLIDEVTRYPNKGSTDDQVYACWFLFTHLPNIVISGTQAPELWVPSWVKEPA